MPVSSISRMAIATIFYLASSCTFLGNFSDSQCKVDEDCSSRGEAFADTVCVSNICQTANIEDPRWRCLGEDPIPFIEPEPVTVRIRLRRFFDNAPVGGASLTACAKADTECEADPPIATATSDNDGDALVDIETGFTGFVRVESSDHVTAFVQLTPSILDENTPIPDVLLMTPLELAELRGFSGVGDEGTGHLLAQSLDCDLEPVEGVSLEVSVTGTNSRAFSLENGSVDFEETTSQTSGRLGYLNLIVGRLCVIAKRTATDEEIVELDSVAIRPGGITYLGVAPAPFSSAF